jgi:hypothetical protein
MKMAVLREHTPWTDGQLPYLGISRQAVEDRVVESTKTFASNWWAKHGDSLYAHINEVITSLPDDDIADLNYAADEMGDYPLAAMFMEKMRSVGALRRQIDETCLHVLGEN